MGRCLPQGIIAGDGKVSAEWQLQALAKLGMFIKALTDKNLNFLQFIRFCFVYNLLGFICVCHADLLDE